MPKKILIALTLLMLTGLVAGLQAKAPPKKVVIDKCKSRKPGVAFHHEKHTKKLKINCKVCHHTGKTKPCVTCHAGKAKGKKKHGCAEMSMKKNPFHVTCVGCHKKRNQGPRNCRACHR